MSKLKHGAAMAAFAIAALCSCGGNAGSDGAAQADVDSLATRADMTLVLDSIKVHWLKDNEGDKLMPSALFDAPDSLMSRLGLLEGVPSSVSAFLVECGGRRILFDTGNGAADSRLMAELDSLGLDGGDIDYVMLTHLHCDHIGGMLLDGDVVFDCAEVYVARQEYDGWRQMPDGKGARAMEVLGRYGERLHLFEYGDSLPCGVVALEASGHTPGHTAYRIGQLLVAGDLIHGAALQLRYPDYCASYDMDKVRAVGARRAMMEYACDEGLTVVGMHFPPSLYVDCLPVE